MVIYATTQVCCLHCNTLELLKGAKLHKLMPCELGSTDMDVTSVDLMHSDASHKFLIGTRIERSASILKRMPIYKPEFTLTINWEYK